MSTFALKMIAIITMLIDHTGAVFVSYAEHPRLYLLMRGVGRLAFPIFVFLIIEGFYHTKNIKKYLARLGSFALISEIPFDFAFYKRYFHSDVIANIQEVIKHPSDTKLISSLIDNLNFHQNVFFTLFLGLLLITLMDMIEKKMPKIGLKNLILSNSIDTALTLVFCAAAYFLKTDYDYKGILLIVAFYLFRGSKSMLAISTLFITSTLMSDFGRFGATWDILPIISVFATFAIIPIAFHNGKKGKNVKYFFYIFYPAHLMLLFLINSYLY